MLNSTPRSLLDYFTVKPHVAQVSNNKIGHGIMSSNKSDLIILLTDIIKAARTGDFSKISSILNQALQILQYELSKGIINSDGITKLSYSLETLTMLQQTEDWVAFADVLEYEFIPLWKSLFLKN